MITEPGIYPDLSATYHSMRHTPTRALSASGIKTLLDETPFDFKNPTPKKSKEMAFGSICHALALGKGSEFAVSPYEEYRTKEAREWRDIQILNGRIPVKQDKYDDAEMVAEVIKSRVEKLLGGAAYETEVPFYWLEGETWCQGMADIWCPELLTAIDPKITKSVGRTSTTQMIKFGWDIQAAWYRRGLEKIMPEHVGRIRFANLLVKPEAPYTARAIMLNEAWRSSAEMECERALRIFQRCMAADEWPGYPDDIEMMDAPGWVLNQRIDAGMQDDAD